MIGWSSSRTRRGGPDLITLVIADDQPLFVEGLQTIIDSKAPDISIIGTAQNGQEAVDLVEALRPDIVLMDVRMPVLDGVNATRQIHETDPDQKILMLTTFDDDDYVRHSLSYGAIGYLLKNRPSAELIAAIRAVHAGVLLIDPAVAKALLRDKAPVQYDEDDFLRRLNSLTRREREVLRLLVAALDNHEIAAEIGVAEQTVRNYVSNLYSKLGIQQRIDILKHARQIEFFLNHV